MLINSLSKFEINDISQFWKMSIDEFFLRSEGYQIKMVDTREQLAMQAWYNQMVQVTNGSDKHPRPKYSKFSQFYDVQELENKVHKSFNSDYVPASESEEETQRNKQDEIMKRFEQLEKHKAKKKKDSH